MNFIKKNFSPGILIISILILFYTYYRSEIFWNGEKKDYYINYYLISCLLIFFSMISFFINQKIKIYLIISSLSIVIALYICEGYLFLKKKSEPIKISKEILKKKLLYEKNKSKKFDIRSRLEIYNDLKKKGSVKLTVFPFSYTTYNFNIFPLSGIANIKTINCNENGYYSIHKSDRYGFNNPDSEWDSQKIEYLLVGDSFVHGACVNRPNDISSNIRRLSKKSVLNLGYGGSAPLIYYATLREYLNDNVKKVIFVFYEGNDLIDLTDEINNKILTQYLDNFSFSQNLKSKQKEIDRLGNLLINQNQDTIDSRKNFNFIKFIKIYNLRHLYIKEFKKIKKTDTAKNLKYFEEILKQTKDLVNEKNAKLYFVYLPEYNRFKEENYKNPIYMPVKKIVYKLDIPFIDIYNKLNKEKLSSINLYPFSLEGHFNSRGYSKISEIIYKLTSD